MRPWVVATVVALLASLPASRAGSQADTSKLRNVTDPRAATGSWVADPGRHLRAATVARVDSIIGALERETTAEIAVAIVDSLDGLEPADAALLLHRRWGVGKRARDNGIVLLWSPALRRVHVSVGYGLEGVLTDAGAGRVQDEHIIPRFRRGDFDGGIVAGVEALASIARRETYSGLPRARAGNTLGEDAARRSGTGTIAGGALAIVALLSALLLGVRRRVPRRCPNGHGFMRRLGETADNARLDAPQRLEEKLGSIDYDVWVCDRCDATRVIPRTRWLSGFSRCPGCRRRTARKSSRELRRPTRTRTGEREVTISCRNCGYERTTVETIPMITESSSSGGGWSGGGGGGGGGSSFGGGSAGGGGAGRGY